VSNKGRNLAKMGKSKEKNGKSGCIWGTNKKDFLIKKD
jgi:hypothetical protein